ncbi:MAG: quinone-dependent dihydroorotate dehydrogenase [Alphaproteobacteria bacterium]|nr:dihydroorotate dehydrogenase (quinone) [Rhodospirillaceae bacterium]MDP6022453.1 quinone-dependent dihydroorotate dehydrogenase [Alphaproteobacteria bacterium]MDP6253358.1 quinone-dependent dihydroorotate dehydrogenase [Alphaproteobacteria bacterium]MDP7053586.1 quinone-dependent dihydroorotate dehydrogenase [Alphaproteobacteria bacterium]MDP7227961.1 quinone-dependent dihydroorotate dehydrogenase [Alphaproteobacteria bacterium]
MIWNLGLRLLHLLDPEDAHRLTIRALRLGLGPNVSANPDPILASRHWGLDFPTPLGVAAGFDKNAEVPVQAAAMGFSFVEIGSVTPQPQAGNPRPRLFRLSDDSAVINRNGFNNEGLGTVARRLAPLGGRHFILGANLGANKDSEDRIADYAAGMAALGPLADYVVVNVSSPNTPGLRDLQTHEALEALLTGVRQACPEPPPVLVKIAPDFDGEGLATLARTLLALSVDGVILGNTTIGLRDGLKSRHRGETGGLSGQPLFEFSTQQLAAFHRHSGGKIPLIGVGGIDSAETAYAKIRNGASLIQLYTGLIYKGPGLIPAITNGLAHLLRQDGFGNITEAVGVDATH